MKTFVSFFWDNHFARHSVLPCHGRTLSVVRVDFRTLVAAIRHCGAVTRNTVHGMLGKKSEQTRICI